ncbi:glycosyltransferase family 4 protein [Algoriphagus winogradskyi]|uniref:Glycosyltransferase involved in cell wall bisynthesis n=1 Tax=Algoriphagus winogradskyi TaxID=237017 RepID=A0ABY1NVW5_9BACT|nr:glycosyltransferase family 4 protein [Algoriphagus winogradskyi]SMP19716.1 Glycosyltransferase involved in cell wall bisynthesis [Algoriphagus winogradskyi]
MKILQIIQKPQARGVELFTCMLSEKLQELGHEIILISIFEGKYDLPYSGKQIHLKRSIKNRFWDLKAWRQFAQVIKHEQPDLIQANAADTLKFSVFSKKIFGWKTPIIFRNASQISQYINSALIKGFNKYLYRNVAAIVSVSHKSKEDFSSVLKLDIPHQIIPIGINLPCDKLANALDENPVLVHIGGFTFEKNHTELIDIFTSIHRKFPDLKLWLIGEGPLKEEIQSKVQSLGLQNYVLFKGTLAEPFRSVPNNSIFVLPSRIEGLPAVILEAFGSCVPVVAYNVGGIPEVLKNNETGWLVEAGDTQAFINALSEVLSTSSKDLNRITSNAKKLVEKNYQIDQIAKKFEAFYINILNPKTD